MIEIQGLVRRFGPVTAVAGVDLTVAKGEVLGFLGPNGAGKSTTMKMVTGFLAPSAGTARICGFDIVEQPLEAQSRLGYLPEGAPAYGEMTPRQFLRFAAAIRGLAGAERESAIATAVAKTQLDAVLDQPIETLSKGFKRRVGLAQAILHDPEVLIMDEPTDGLDPNQKHAVRRLIREMAPEKAIVISTHILEEVEAICTRAVIIDRGRIVADGTPHQLVARSRHHNAVTLTVAPAQGAAVRAAFAGQPYVAALEEGAGDGGLARFTLFPKNGDLIIDDVAARVSAAGLKVQELYAEAGRLDEVFRALTTSDARLPAEGAEAA